MTTLNYATITGTFTDGSDQPMDGFVTFTPSQAVYSAGVYSAGAPSARAVCTPPR